MTLLEGNNREEHKWNIKDLMNETTDAQSRLAESIIPGTVRDPNMLYIPAR